MSKNEMIATDGMDLGWSFNNNNLICFSMEVSWFVGEILRNLVFLVILIQVQRLNFPDIFHLWNSEYSKLT